MGPLKKDLTRAGVRVLRVVEALGGSFVRVLRVREGSRGVSPLTNLSAAVIPGVSAKERPSRAWGEGDGGEARSVVFYEGLRLWEARFVVFYEGLRLWEAHLYVFYVSGRLSGGTMSNGA